MVKSCFFVLAVALQIKVPIIRSRCHKQAFKQLRQQVIKMKESV
ncbi:protein of unknown function [Vibrio tapetis subsp. tapetis]|uniref:Uncharacterized protein n=1 Tax=Vibrio tapetis subsp. tapetis TaxID=1671868 RepID=A0A2N8ZF18_9VIBR|nr:protein of unknown function [Vibrio tapetis subsp. tapetis]